jgi:hypothetical protein
MMGNRVVNLIATLFSYKKYGVFLLSENNGIVSALQSCDDLGLFMYVPMISILFSTDPLVAAKMLFVGVTVLFVIATGICFSFLARTLVGYFVIVYGLYRLASVLQKISDVYIVYVLPFIAIPVLLIALEKKYKKIFLFSFFFAGLLGGFSDIVRSYAALPVILFFIIILLFNSTFPRFRKVFPFILLLVGYSIPQVHFQYVLHQRNVFLEQQHTSTEEIKNTHVFWHNMYIGLGFLANQYDIVWDDACGLEHARKIIPDVELESSVYDPTIRNLIFKLIKTDRDFIFNVLFAKFGVLLFYFLSYFGFFGLLAAYFVPKAWYVELAFLCCAGLSAVPGLLTLPTICYFLGFITCTVLYAIYSILWFLNNNGGKQVQKSYYQFIKIIKNTE